MLSLDVTNSVIPCAIARQRRTVARGRRGYRERCALILDRVRRHQSDSTLATPSDINSTSNVDVSVFSPCVPPAVLDDERV